MSAPRRPARDGSGAHPLALDEQLWDGEMRGCIVDGVPVLLAKIEGRVCAYLDACAHLGARLSDGVLEGTVVTCRAHHWQYDLRTGAGVNPTSVRLRPLPCAVADGKVIVDVAGARPSEARIVGPVLLRSAAARAIAAAICAANDGAEVESRGAYLRIHARSPCIVTREAIATQLGGDFAFPGDLETAMPSYRGHLTLTDEGARWD